MFFESFQMMIDEMPDEMGKRFYRYISDYGLYGKEPELKDGIERALWIPIKISLDSMSKKGKRGRKTGTSTSCKKAVISEKAEEKREEVECEQSASEEADSEKSEPTLEEVESEIKDKGYIVSAKEFFDYYTASGWKTQNGNVITDWKKSLKYWNSRTYYSTQSAPPSPQEREQRDSDGILRATKAFLARQQQWQKECEKEREDIAKMRQEHPKEWAVCFEKRRAENPDELQVISEYEVYRTLAKAS